MKLCFHEGRAMTTPGPLAVMRVLVGVLVAVLLATLVGSTGCTEVRVQETAVDFRNSLCRSDSGGGMNSGGGGGGQSMPTGLMDTYIVQIYELYDSGDTSQAACDTCLASRSNCFFEKESCVCGDLVSVSPARLPEMLSGVRVPVAANYGSLYCLRILAVERSSQPEQCSCDSNWETASRVRLCSASAPYAAGPVPVELDVQCSSNRSFSTCLGDLQPAN
jgi:hypothetical protein